MQGTMEAPVHGFVDYDETVRPFAVYLKAAIWPFPSDLAQKPVYVCWENLGNSKETDRQLVALAIRETWESHSKLQFRGWSECAPNNRGIRIAVDDSGPHVKALGRFIDGQPNGMVLNFTFSNWSRSCAQSEARRLQCIYSIAVHEFGHAIGLAHEQNRWDAPGECQELRQGTNGDLLLTPYDPESAMNYCNERYNNDGQLSELDKKAVASVYGEPAR